MPLALLWSAVPCLESPSWTCPYLSSSSSRLYISLAKPALTSSGRTSYRCTLNPHCSLEQASTELEFSVGVSVSPSQAGATSFGDNALTTRYQVYIHSVFTVAITKWELSSTLCKSCGSVPSYQGEETLPIPMPVFGTTDRSFKLRENGIIHNLK